MNMNIIQGLILIVATLFFFVKNVFFRKNVTLENSIGGGIISLLFILLGSMQIVLGVF
jgi:hypothetical protein